MKTNFELKLQANKVLKNNWGIILLAITLTELIASLIVASIIGSVAIFFIAGPLQLGLTIMLLKVSRGKNTEIKDLFEGFKNFSNSFALYILQFIYIFFWTLLFIIPGIIKGYSYSMAYYILADNPKMSGNDAITASRKMMDGNKWRLFSLQLSFIGWIILGTIILGSTSFAAFGVDFFTEAAIIPAVSSAVIAIIGMLVSTVIFVFTSLYLMFATTEFYENLKGKNQDLTTEVTPEA